MTSTELCDGMLVVATCSGIVKVRTLSRSLGIVSHVSGRFLMVQFAQQELPLVPCEVHPFGREELRARYMSPAPLGLMAFAAHIGPLDLPLIPVRHVISLRGRTSPLKGFQRVLPVIGSDSSGYAGGD